MNFKNERMFTRWFCRMVTARGAKTIAIVGSMRQESGISDRYIAHSKFRGWIEFKHKWNCCSPLQRLFLGDMKAKHDVAMCSRFLPSLGRVTFEDELNDIYHQFDIIEMEYLSSDKDRGKALLDHCTLAWKKMQCRIH